MARRNQRSAEAKAYRRLYNTARWQRVRAHQLAAHPLCAMCLEQGRYTPATVCDHVDPESKRTIEGFYSGPFASLCAHHHDGEKQQIEARGYSTRVGEDGWPIDGSHPANRRR